MSNRLQIDIPVRPHVWKYLNQKCFLKNASRLSCKDHVGKYLDKLLESKKKQKSQLVAAKPGCIISIEVSNANNKKNNHYFSEEHIKDFNWYVDSYIKEECFSVVQILVNSIGMKVHDALHMWRDQYLFEDEELTFENIRQDYYRKLKDTERIDFAA